MPYTLLRQDATPDSWMVLTIRQIPRRVWLTGTPWQGITEPVQVVLAAGRDSASDFLELPCPVVSDRMRSALDRAGVDNIQYLRASLEQRLSDRAITGYWIANVFGTVACVDRERSVIESESESYAGYLRSFQVDLRATHALRLFRVAADRRLIAIHERVRAALEEARLRGVLYQSTSAYDGYPVSSASPRPAVERGW